MLHELIVHNSRKPDETFITDPGTFFAPQMLGKPTTGEPVAAVVRREVSAPPSACKPRTVATLNHNKVFTDNLHFTYLSAVTSANVQYQIIPVFYLSAVRCALLLNIHLEILD